jgi:hypothetical protein
MLNAQQIDTHFPRFHLYHEYFLTNYLRLLWCGDITPDESAFAPIPQSAHTIHSQPFENPTGTIAEHVLNGLTETVLQQNTAIERNIPRRSGRRTRSTPSSPPAIGTTERWRRHRRARLLRTLGSAVKVDFDQFDELLHALPPEVADSVRVGDRSVVCVFCSSRNYADEPKGICCREGKVKLPELNDPPSELVQLYTLDRQDRNSAASFFVKHSITFNHAFAMVSVSMPTPRMLRNSYAPTVVVQGEVRRWLGTLEPPGATPSFLQTYLYNGDFNDEVSRRVQGVMRLNRNVRSGNSNVSDTNNASEYANHMSEDKVEHIIR